MVIDDLGAAEPPTVSTVTGANLGPLAEKKRRGDILTPLLRTELRCIVHTELDTILSAVSKLKKSTEFLSRRVVELDGRSPEIRDLRIDTNHST